MNGSIKSKPIYNDELDWRIRVFDSLSFPTLILKTDHTIIQANEIFLQTFELTRQDVIGHKCYEIFYGHKDCLLSGDCPFTKVIQTRQGHSVLKRVYYSHRGIVWEDRVFSPILDDNREIMYVIESIRDVTRIKTLEQELSGIREFVERVVESSPSAIVAALRNGRILLMNPAAKDLFGFDIREPQHHMKTARDLYPSSIAEEIMRKLRDPACGGDGKLPATPITIVNTDGDEIPVEMTAAIIYDNDEEVATMAIYNDLRDKIAYENKLKEAQKQLAQSEKMATMGQFAAGVAHEINNPLAGILLYASLAKEQSTPDESLFKYMSYVIEDTNRCKEIVKNLLVYSRQTESAKDIFQLNDLVNHALYLIRDQKLFSRITVRKEISDAMMLVNGDINQLSQVVINLVLNAVDAMQAEGILTFTTYRDVSSAKVYLEISDTGPGIPPERLSRIFDPFFTTKEPGKGTGLGLSTAYGIMEEHAGSIEVKNTGSHGTTFLLTLPLFKPKEVNNATDD